MKTFLGLLLLSSVAAAQNSAPTANGQSSQRNPHAAPRHVPERFMTEQIKHVADFIARFNKAADARESGGAELMALFNEDDARLRGNARIAHPYAATVEALLRETREGKVRIAKHPGLDAAIRVSVTYLGKPDTLDIGLEKEYTVDSAAYWHVTELNAPKALFDENPKIDHDVPEKIKLPPNAHEVSFLPLLGGMADYRSILAFAGCGPCTGTAWGQVEHALRGGRLKVEAVVSNRLFLTAGHWRIELMEFIREKENSGWLINNLMEE